jgi:ATP-dependent helicase/nuclease subunit B
MPYSDPGTDLELARAVTARIAASAPRVIFSHAERNQDGELRPSPLLPGDAEWQNAPCVRTEHEAQELEVLEEASEVVAWPQERSPGGYEVLKHQAACAFQAFATKRLRAEPLNRSEWGLSAAARGVLLHKTLEKIWSPSNGALHSLDELQSATHEGRLGEILIGAIADAFAKFGPVEDTWMRAYLASEQRRLRIRLEEWMNEEAMRVPFRVVACEQKLNDVRVGDLMLNLRADRIDEVGTSDRLLIDYKSGEVSPSDWQPPRPNEPQLPLYAVFGNVEDVRGVLFAQIRAGATGFRGSVTDVRSQLFANAKASSALVKEPYSESLRDGWHDALLKLAGDFLRGEAAVNPKEGKKTCAHCPLPGLCRVAEVLDALEEGDKAGECRGDE